MAESRVGVERVITKGMVFGELVFEEKRHVYSSGPIDST